ncbi:MAG: hypothetical protein EHM70_14035 [Chloroflexota bacterium]|nr:MAG: hypothetical protein EHM70_14035 [Chloroflexota bacterium]
MITVRQATLVDRPAIFTFIRSVYENRWQYKIPERWEWEFVNNPYLESRSLPVWIAVDEDGRVVGQTCALVEPVKIGDRLCRLGWSVDTYLLREYRGQGLGFQLQKANDEGNPIFMSLSMTSANRRIKAGLGSVPLEPVAEFRRLIRYEPESIRAAAARRLEGNHSRLRKAVQAFFRWTLVDRILSAGLNLWLDARDLRKIPAPDPEVAVTPVAAFGPEIDTLWDKVSPHFYAIIQRDQAYLNWKYGSQPHVMYIKCIARKNQEVSGYIILRVGKPPERKVGIIADIFVEPKDRATLRALLAFALRYFKTERVKDVVAATTVKEYQACLLELGFKLSGEAVPMFHSKLEGMDVAAITQPGAWFFSKGDHDWDQFPLSR